MILLFVTLPTPNYPKILQIKRRYSIIHSDEYYVRLFYPVPSVIISKSLLTKEAGTSPSKVWFPASLTHHRYTHGRKTMITIFVEENNTLSPNFYNNLINSLQFHRLTCTCGHASCLSIHGYYTRSLKTPAGRLTFRICRVICSCCHHTHALLPSSMVPYSQISLSEHVEVISCHQQKQGWGILMNRNPSIDESNCRYIIRSFLKHWKQRLLSEKITLSDRATLVCDCFLAFIRQFMQIHCTPNILFMNTT